MISSLSSPLDFSPDPLDSPSLTSSPLNLVVNDSSLENLRSSDPNTQERTPYNGDQLYGDQRSHFPNYSPLPLNYSSSTEKFSPEPSLLPNLPDHLKYQPQNVFFTPNFYDNQFYGFSGHYSVPFNFQFPAYQFGPNMGGNSASYSGSKGCEESLESPPCNSQLRNYMTFGHVQMTPGSVDNIGKSNNEYPQYTSSPNDPDNSFVLSSTQLPGASGSMEEQMVLISPVLQEALPETSQMLFDPMNNIHFDNSNHVAKKMRYSGELFDDVENAGIALPDSQGRTSSKSQHICNYCGKIYSRRYGLKIHLRTHSGYKPLKCTYCARTFSDPSNLNKHTKLHFTTQTNKNGVRKVARLTVAEQEDDDPDAFVALPIAALNREMNFGVSQHLTVTEDNENEERDRISFTQSPQRPMIEHEIESQTSGQTTEPVLNFSALSGFDDLSPGKPEKTISRKRKIGQVDEFDTQNQWNYVSSEFETEKGEFVSDDLFTFGASETHVKSQCTGVNNSSTEHETFPVTQHFEAVGGQSWVNYPSESYNHQWLGMSNESEALVVSPTPLVAQMPTTLSAIAQEQHWYVNGDDYVNIQYQPDIDEGTIANNDTELWTENDNYVQTNTEDFADPAFFDKSPQADML